MDAGKATQLEHAVKYIIEFLGNVAQRSDDVMGYGRDLGTWWFEQLQYLGDMLMNVLGGNTCPRPIIPVAIIGIVLNILQDWPCRRLGIPEIYVLVVTFRLPTYNIKFKKDILGRIEDAYDQKYDYYLSGGALLHLDRLLKLKKSVYDGLNERYQQQSQAS
jgi:hypothetical protein